MTNLGVNGYPAGSPSTVARAQLALTARGLISESFPLAAAVNTQSAATQTLFAELVGLQAGDVVTSIVMAVSSVSSLSITLAKVAIYSSAGTLLVGSSDLSGSLFASTGYRSGALSVPYRVPTAGGYFLALLVVGSTPPTLFRAMAQGAVTGAATSSGVAMSGTQGSLSDLPSSLTITTANTVWLAAA